MRRPVWAEIDLGAVAHNVGVLTDLVAPARVCAVVKAGAYGHGAVEVARAALEAGASWLAVALVEEGDALRRAGVDAPILLLSEPPAGLLSDVVALRLTPTLYTPAGVEAAAKAVAEAGTGPLPVHVKVDSGMHRCGAPPQEATALAADVTERRELCLEGLWTHFAVADDPTHPFTEEQAARFEAVVDRLAELGIRPPLLHACNSAAALTRPPSRYQLVRCGITVYGVPPSPALAGRADLRPAMSVRARVSHVREVAAGEGVSYGLRRPVDHAIRVAVVPVGYADGVPWRLTLGEGEVLIAGRRRPLAGSVTMDQLMVDCGDDDTVGPGDEVVLLGHQGEEQIDAWEWAGRAGTIAYEVLCGISARVPKLYV